MNANLDYKAIINKIIVAMISANQRVWTSNNMKDLCRMVTPHSSEWQIEELMKRIRQDDRIAKNKVSSRKICYSYRGEF